MISGMVPQPRARMTRQAARRDPLQSFSPKHSP